MVAGSSFLSYAEDRVTPFVPNDGYTPIGDFVQQMQPEDSFPYDTRISLKPLLEHLCKFRGKPLHIHHRLLQPMVQTLEAAQAELEAHGRLPAFDNPDEKPDWASLFNIFFPLHYHEGAMGYVTRPFTSEFLFQSASFQALLQQESQVIRPQCSFALRRWNHIHILQAASVILYRIGGPDVRDIFPQIFELSNPADGLSRFFKVHLSHDFLWVVSPPNPRLPDSQTIRNLLREPGRYEDWLEIFPPSQYRFEGLVFAHFEEITQSAVLSNIKNRLLENITLQRPEEMVAIIEFNLRNFLQIPGMRAGFFLPDECKDHLPDDSLLAHHFSQGFNAWEEASVYRKVLETNDFWVCEDLEQAAAGPEELDIYQAYRIQDFRSLLLIPLSGEDGRPLGILELAHPEAHRLDAITPFRLNEPINLLSQGLQRFLREWRDQEQLVIQQEFTSIHPAVAWKFREVAERILSARLKGAPKPMEPIVFHGVYALYGQADIVGSSKNRNESIRTDLLQNLQLLLHCLHGLLRETDYPMLDVFRRRVTLHAQRLEQQYLSSDETQITQLLQDELHPALRQIAQESSDKARKIVERYFGQLDPEYQMVYDQKKRFEQSVEQLRSRLAELMENEQVRMQQILPHLFDIHQTDGIDYNIYLGASLLKNGRFSDFHLRNFRLWQLQNMCRLTRRAAEVSPQLPMPLTTAQLVFVYSQPLSIQFRMDEKQFDVDGVYNARYEILKKRIDKAYLKDKGERLTQSGKIAVVFLHEHEREEYLSYIDYLREQGEIEEEIEEVELERTQEMEGLSAFRLTVASLPSS